MRYAVPCVAERVSNFKEILAIYNWYIGLGVVDEKRRSNRGISRHSGVYSVAA